MPQDYYSDEEGPDAMTREAMGSDSAKADETPAGNEDQATFLLPKSALMGKNVQDGDTIKVRVLRMMDDQVEAVCVYGDEDKEEASEPPEGGNEAMQPSSSPIASMME